uniref:Uncharacterized protein n=1 Tax=Anguilla anguilla TaxID=7936 RepID=A0A0E9W320_ANGAN
MSVLQIVLKNLSLLSSTDPNSNSLPTEYGR